MILAPHQDEPRTPAQVRQHYEVEKELADRLRTATREQRRLLYRSVYNELYQRVPHHPQLTRKSSPELTREALGPQLRLLKPFLRDNSTFLEIGPGDCALSLVIAEQVCQVYGLDVSDEITHQALLPSNFKLILSDGMSVPLPPDSVDVAYSNQLIEHLHPEDALEQLQGIWRALRPGGVYICVTPNRLNGPHDVSKHFDPVATGFHLKEYTVGDLSQLFRSAGFRKVRSLLGGRGAFVPVPVAPIAALEGILGLVPPPIRRALTLAAPCRAFLGIRVVGTK